MAKVVGLVGSASGKIGNMVYAVTNGIQIARVYQPNVSNPKSIAQNKQRSKANLIGQVSKVTPWQILIGLGNNRRERRSRFLRLGLRNADIIESQLNPNSYVARLKSDKFIFSEGALVPAISMQMGTAGNNTITFTLTRITGTSDEEFAASGVLVVLVLMTLDGTYESVLYKFVSSDEFVEGVFSGTINHVREGGYNVNFYYAPFTTIDGGSLATVTGQLYGDNFDLTAEMSINPASLPVIYGNSQFVGSRTYQPA